MQIWLLLDRLDVAFAETHELERNALRALFRVCRDLAEHDAIKLRIFLRSDIWGRITEGGFREASHIMKSTGEVRFDDDYRLHPRYDVGLPPRAIEVPMRF